MRSSRVCLMALGLTMSGCASAPTVADAVEPMRFQRPVSTYSIVARDPATGELERR